VAKKLSKQRLAQVPSRRQLQASDNEERILREATKHLVYECGMFWRRPVSGKRVSRDSVSGSSL